MLACRGMVSPFASKTQSLGTKPEPSREAARASALTVLLYVPNLIGYGRLMLLTTAAVANAQSQAGRAIGLILLNMILDGLDGAAARRLGQVSMPAVRAADRNNDGQPRRRV